MKQLEYIPDKGTPHVIEVAFGDVTRLYTLEEFREIQKRINFFMRHIDKVPSVCVVVDIGNALPIASYTGKYDGLSREALQNMYVLLDVHYVHLLQHYSLMNATGDFERTMAISQQIDEIELELAYINRKIKEKDNERAAKTGD